MEAEKRTIAMALLRLRDDFGVAQGDVTSRSGLGMGSVVDLEALTGPVPDADLVEQYVTGVRQRISGAIADFNALVEASGVRLGGFRKV